MKILLFIILPLIHLSSFAATDLTDSEWDGRYTCWDTKVTIDEDGQAKVAKKLDRTSMKFNLTANQYQMINIFTSTMGAYPLIALDYNNQLEPVGESFLLASFGGMLNLSPDDEKLKQMVKAVDIQYVAKRSDYEIFYQLQGKCKKQNDSDCAILNAVADTVEYTYFSDGVLEYRSQLLDKFLRQHFGEDYEEARRDKKLLCFKQ